MRRVAKLLNPVLVSRTLGVLARDQILNCDDTAGAQNPAHFLQRSTWVLKMVEGKPANHQVKLSISEGKLIRVAHLE